MKSAEKHLAALREICSLPCEELTDLEREVAKHRKSRRPALHTDNVASNPVNDAGHNRAKVQDANTAVLELWRLVWKPEFPHSQHERIQKLARSTVAITAPSNHSTP